jgi:hypothetical protein
MESDNPENLDSASPPQTPKTISSKSIPIEIEPGKTLNINPHLTDAETQQLTKLLQENKEAFAWDYTNMKGISLTYVLTEYILRKIVDQSLNPSEE